MIQNLVFDIGGVIIDDGDAPLLKTLGLPLDDMKKLEGLLYNNPRWSDGVMLGKITQKDYMHEVIRQYPEWKAEIKKCFAPRYQSQVVPIIRENLDYILSLKPKYKLYILSNLTDATYRYLRKVLQNFDGGIYSFQAHVKKPDPEIYQMLFQKYNLNPAECIFFDDRKANLEAGEKLGMRGVQVRSLDDIKSVNLS